MSTTSKVAWVPQAQTESTPAKAPGTEYNLSVGYLRAFITVLVVAHHAVLAYHPFAPPPPTTLDAQPRLWQAFPVVDTAHWSGFGLLVGFNDIFFMSLMFFLSGLFVWKSLQRKGAGNFVRDRALRLSIPFALAAAIAPLSYYPAYLILASHYGISGFWQQWRALGTWPAGPAWFIWVLLVFDCGAAVLFIALPKWGEVIGRISANASLRPVRLFGLLLVISGLAYVPMALRFTPYDWVAFGPFFFQTSRIIHYLVYFLLGVGIGAFGIDRGLLASNGKLSRRWLLWTLRALFAFGIASAVTIAAFSPHNSPRLWEIFMDSTFVLSCAASCFAFLAIFVRFARRRIRAWDSLAANAYGIYLIHYGFVIWLQYLFLKAPLPAIAKGSLVLAGSVSLSWAATATLRRIPAVARVI